MKKRTSFKILYVLGAVALLVAGCTSTPTTADNASPYSDISEGFMAQEPRTFRDPKFLPSDYFYKQCSQRLIDNFYSKTEYFCN